MMRSDPTPGQPQSALSTTRYHNVKVDSAGDTDNDSGTERPPLLVEMKIVSSQQPPQASNNMVASPETDHQVVADIEGRPASHQSHGLCIRTRRRTILLGLVSGFFILISITLIAIVVFIGGDKRNPQIILNEVHSVYAKGSKYASQEIKAWIWLDDDHIMDPKSGNVYSMASIVSLVNVSTAKQIVPKGSYLSWDINDDASRGLLSYDRTRILGGRSRELKRYMVVRLNDSFHAPLAPSPTNNSTGEHLRMVAMAPNGHSLVYWQQGSLFYVQDPLNPAENEPKKIIGAKEDEMEFLHYAVADWLYEEEILQKPHALWWSPDSARVAFFSFNDKNVTSIQVPIYGNGTPVFVKMEKLRYPVAGDAEGSHCPEVNIHIYHVANNTVQQLTKPAFLHNEEHYIMYTMWASSHQLVVEWQLRVFDAGFLTLYDFKEEKWHVLYEFRPQQGWSTLHYNLLDHNFVSPAPASRHLLFFVVANMQSVDQRQFHQVAYVHLLDLSKGIQFVSHEGIEGHDADSVLSYHAPTDTLLYAAWYPDASQTHLIRAHLSRGTAECLTCADPGCRYNQFHVSPITKSILQLCKGPGYPRLIFSHMDNDKAVLNEVRVLWNAAPRNSPSPIPVVPSYYPRVEYTFLTVRPRSPHEDTFRARIIYPPNFSPSRKYPLYLSVYGGPGSHRVKQKFSMFPEFQYAIQYNMVVLFVDGRGTMGRGRQFLTSVQYKLGVYDVQDQVDAVKALIDKGFIDSSRIAVNGWSYGGFLSGHILAHPVEPSFKCGIIGAPVTDFRYYDIAYTERFLGRIGKHSDAYMATNLMRKARQFINKKVLLIHGSADDNVRLINSMHFLDALFNIGVDIKFIILRDDGHSSRREQTQIEVQRFIGECLK